MITRFAPSPTGPLHLGHAYSAWLAHDTARKEGGTFLLRIEDIDRTRSRDAWEQQIYDDLSWLGITWDGTPMRQSDRVSVYEDALATLWKRGLVYPCSCSRKDIAAAANAPQEGSEPVFGPDGLVYPGTCRPNRPHPVGDMPEGIALRLDLTAALQHIGSGRLGFVENGETNGSQRRNVAVTSDDLISTVGDIVLSRKDFPGSYHLSVVLDDAAQNITHVIRGKDLFDATKIHVLLQRLLGLPTPLYLHHRLIRDETGRRLAKRDDARAIAQYRKVGATPDDLRTLVGL
ncbi:tRNA glutamyl-Q(34) synthetase GluQRS [Tropicibacter sp. S64]|uniref:tRNA glutamyl-Q(34) synthetase GluQRS n=1 Tax=Tropicibacter sp. S64 TaxID=3415122 RepID=UPI003C7B6B0E